MKLQPILAGLWGCWQIGPWGRRLAHLKDQGIMFFFCKWGLGWLAYTGLCVRTLRIAGDA